MHSLIMDCWIVTLIVVICIATILQKGGKGIELHKSNVSIYHRDYASMNQKQFHLKICGKPRANIPTYTLSVSVCLSASLSLPPVIFTLLTLELNFTLLPERYVWGNNHNSPFSKTDGFGHVDIVTLCTENVNRLHAVN